MKILRYISALMLIFVFLTGCAATRKIGEGASGKQIPGTAGKTGEIIGVILSVRTYNISILNNANWPIRVRKETGIDESYIIPARTGYKRMLFRFRARREHALIVEALDKDRIAVDAFQKRFKVSTKRRKLIATKLWTVRNKDFKRLYRDLKRRQKEARRAKRRR